MKIAVCEFHQETCSFNPVLTRKEDYNKGGAKEEILEGEDLFLLRGLPVALAGKFAAIEEYGGEIVPLISMVAQSGGPADHQAVDYFIEKTVSGLKAALPVDGVFVGLHGATQSDTSDDVCGDILEMIRKVAGEKAVITASTDLHANITKKMADNADFICGYHTYPHVDFYETGYRSAKFGLMKITGEANLKMARAAVPMIAPASAYTTLHGPFREIMDYALSLIDSGELTDCSIYQMQPWLDVREGGSAILTISPDEEKALFYANELAKKLYQARKEFAHDLFPIDQVIEEAEQNHSGKPYILVDASDSPDAGATGDSAALLRGIKEKESDVKAAICLNDVPASEQAFVLGVGARGKFSIGGTIDPLTNPPVEIEAQVVSLHDGTFFREGPAQRGCKCESGKTAVLRYRNTDIIVCQHIQAPGDPQTYRHFGVEPTFYQLINIKACTSWRAAYEPLMAKAFLTDTTGHAQMNLHRLRFRHLPEKFFPFAEISEADITAAEICTKG